MDELEYVHTTPPKVTVIEAGEKARNQHGHRFGSQQLLLTLEELQALIAGKQLAVDVMEDEYVLFISAPAQPRNPKERGDANDSVYG